MLAQVVRADPTNETAWLWLSYAVDDVGQKRQCLSRVLELNPSNQQASQVLATVSQLDAPVGKRPLGTPPQRRRPARRRTVLALGCVALLIAAVGVTALGMWWFLKEGFVDLGIPPPSVATPVVVPGW